MRTHTHAHTYAKIVSMSGGKPPHPRLFTGGYAPLRQEKPCITPAATCSPCIIFHAHEPAATHADSLNNGRAAPTGSESNPRPISSNPLASLCVDTELLGIMVFLPPQVRCDTAGFHNVRDEYHMRDFLPLKYTYNSTATHALAHAGGLKHEHPRTPVFISSGLFPQIHLPRFALIQNFWGLWFFPCLNITKKQA